MILADRYDQSQAVPVSLREKERMLLVRQLLAAFSNVFSYTNQRHRYPRLRENGYDPIGAETRQSNFDHHRQEEISAAAAEYE
jgi:hypothetical protein